MRKKTSGKPRQEKNYRKIVNHGIRAQKLYENKKMKKMELCGVVRAFVQISENGSQSKKFGQPRYKVLIFHRRAKRLRSSVKALETGFHMLLFIHGTKFSHQFSVELRDVAKGSLLQRKKDEANNV